MLRAWRLWCCPRLGEWEPKCCFLSPPPEMTRRFSRTGVEMSPCTPPMWGCFSGFNASTIHGWRHVFGEGDREAVHDTVYNDEQFY